MTALGLKSDDAKKTYRYVRLGMVGAVVLLGASILLEQNEAPSGCWQRSISAYYYTPVRVPFVGAMIAVGLALIVIKGRDNFEDFCLNLAGMLAPVVAIIPTMDIGRCWSVPPNPLPRDPDGQLALWVRTNMDNNFQALLIAYLLGWAAAVVIAIVGKPDIPIRISLVGAGTLLLFGWWLIKSWDGFFSLVPTEIGPIKFTGVHGPAAVLMFVFLIGAVIGKAVQHRARRRSIYFWAYLLLALLMPIGGILIAWLRFGGDNTVAVLEAFEIVLFALFWLVQTFEYWDEVVVVPQGETQL